MSTRARACAWIAAIGFVLPSLTSGQERTERELLDLIVRDGPQARAIRAEADVVRREQQARLALPNPTFSYSREGAGFTEFFQAEQALPLFGVRSVLARAGLATSAAAEAERDGRLWALRAEAATVVARLVAEQARLDAARTQIRDVERLIGILRAREREGEGSRFDRMRAEHELHETRQLETAATVAVVEARAALAGMLPREVAVPTITAPSQALPPPPDAPEKRAAAARAELRALQQLAVRATHEADAARLARLPSPAVVGGLKRADNGAGRETGGIIGLALSVPLFDRGGLEAARWAAERVRVEAERAALEQRIQSEIAGARDVLAARQAALAQDDAGAAETLVQMAELAYREGETGILELLDAVRTTARARMRSIDRRLDVRLAQIVLERAVGEVLWP
jgi:cobalt-zinc-cadmium efflux system outer membrane protein